MAVFTAIGTALGATGIAATGLGMGVTAGVGAVGYSVFNMLNKPKSENQMQSQMPTSPKAPTQEDAAAAAQAKLTEKKRAMARNESVYTNPLGLKDEAEVVRKTLLGG